MLTTNPQSTSKGVKKALTQVIENSLIYRTWNKPQGLACRLEPIEALILPFPKSRNVSGVLHKVSDARLPTSAYLTRMIP